MGTAMVDLPESSRRTLPEGLQGRTPPHPPLEVVVCEGCVCASPSEPSHRCPPPTTPPWPLKATGWGPRCAGPGRGSGRGWLMLLVSDLAIHHLLLG